MEQVATFTHLPAGKFTFCLEVSEDNEWKGNCISIIIESKPPFWKRKTLNLKKPTKRSINFFQLSHTTSEAHSPGYLEFLKW
jgi:hypothetical protein